MTGEEALELALDAARDGNDALTETELALVILRAEAGEAPLPDGLAEDLADLTEPACTCPPGLVERGGFRSSCRARGRWARAEP